MMPSWSAMNWENDQVLVHSTDGAPGSVAQVGEFATLWTPLRGLTLLLLAGVAYFGWREFWFLTDDAYIPFRYISNHVLGYGYTWNPPPFRPVEGYTSFLWMVLLEGVWRLFGVKPPDAANWLSLGFSYGTLTLGFLLVWRMNLSDRLASLRFSLAVMVLAMALTNRTFLTWMSSGLETALFVFLVTGWLFACVAFDRRQEPRQLLWICAAAVAVALTRPDGLLFVGASGVLVVFQMLRSPPRSRWLSALIPFLFVAAHFRWRLSYYGEWLPNTYYAKHVAAWPEAGGQYLFSFLLEYGLWLWLTAVLAAAMMFLVRRRLGATEYLWKRPGVTLAVLTMGAQFAYYTLIIGGDHFEYRIYAHLIVPLAVVLVAACSSLGLPRWLTIAVLVTQLLVSLPLPWTHYLLTRGMTDRAHTRMLFKPIAPFFPQPLRAYAELFDEEQKWLIEHYIGLRHQDHKTAYQFLIDRFPERGEMERGDPNDRPVLRVDSVGVVGWVLPEVAIIDLHGLNDWVIARNPVQREQGDRMMAHDRSPPPGYVRCFRPNVEMRRRDIKIHPRAAPLTREQIIACERHFAAWVGAKTH